MFEFTFAHSGRHSMVRRDSGFRYAKQYASSRLQSPNAKQRAHDVSSRYNINTYKFCNISNVLHIHNDIHRMQSDFILIVVYIHSGP